MLDTSRSGMSGGNENRDGGHEEEAQLPAEPAPMLDFLERIVVAVEQMAGHMKIASRSLDSICNKLDHMFPHHPPPPPPRGSDSQG